ncbi:MAG TPA: PAS domain-containing protein [Rhizomicrobium sp.]|jgi:hypothetical protein
MDRATVARTYNALAALNGWPVYCDSTLTFDHPELEKLLAILEAVRGDRRMPERADLTARMMKDHLAHMTIYERVAGSRWRVRLMGTRFAGAFGDLTGKIIQDDIPAGRVARFEATLDLALRSEGPLRFLAQADVVGKAFLVAEYLVAPLADEAGDPAMVLSRAHFSTAVDWTGYLAEAMKRITANAA